MEIKNLNSKGICDIIKTCKDMGVNYLEIDTLKVQFGQTNSGLMGTWPAVGGTQPTPIQSGSIESPPIQIDEQMEMDPLHQRAVEDLASVQTLIDNPSQFEQDICDGFINEKGDDNDTEKPRRVSAAL